MEAFQTVEAVLFDLDDTLCAYWEASRAGLRAAFGALGPKVHDPEEWSGIWAGAFRTFYPTIKDSDWYKHYLNSGGITRTELMRLTLLEAGIDDATLAEQLSERYARERDAALRLFPDAIDVLERLGKRFPLGLITNGPADVQRQEIVTLGIEQYFDHILIEGEMGEGKPLPAVFERAKSLFRKRPDQLLFVGNSYGHDIRPAIQAGWRTAWIRRATDISPSSPNPDVEALPTGAPEPDLTIGELSELLPYLEG